MLPVFPLDEARVAYESAFEHLNGAVGRAHPETRPCESTGCRFEDPGSLTSVTASQSRAKPSPIIRRCHPHWSPPCDFTSAAAILYSRSGCAALCVHFARLANHRSVGAEQQATAK